MPGVAIKEKESSTAKAVLSEKELADELGLSKWTIRHWRITAGLPYFGTQGRIFYRLESVIKWMEQEEERNSTKSLTSSKKKNNTDWKV